MTLFEITTGRCGESYERAYVWAKNELTARILFLAKYPDSNIEAAHVLVIGGEQAPFVTDLSDSGFTRESDIRWDPAFEVGR